ncbi:ion transporter [Deinococcus pimensis]|uniref:ion transporter n=1 Tax=Deinococcus pimensis TaxID=309888 RepID=UPI00047F0F0F|nr:ion transporter [Deinococcus pimensis]
MSAYRDTRPPWRVALGNVIFESDTRAGRAFDLLLIVLILLSVLSVMLESVEWIRASYGGRLRDIEGAFTLLFTVEYFLRLVSARRWWRYALSPLGFVDLVAILPAYLVLFLPGAQYLLVIRALRLLRIFRILKLTRYLSEANLLTSALRASSAKIVVFLATVLTLVTIIGAAMYVIEGPRNGYTSIPTSIYWAIVTLTTVGYGDIAPKTGLGKALASLAMILGYGIIAVPTGIVTAGIAREQARRDAGRVCPNCGLSGHDGDALHCRRCGARLPDPVGGAAQGVGE